MESNSSFADFCGGTFWDFDLLWENSSPQFTLCFQVTVLVWVPCAFLWFLLFPYSYYLHKLETEDLPRSSLNILKTIFGTLLVLVTLADLVKGAIDFSNDERPEAYIVSPLILALTLFVSLVLIQVERKKAIVTSGVLFLFHVLLVVAGVVPFYMKIIDPDGQGAQYDLFRFITFYVYYIFLLVQFILLCFAETVPVPNYFPGKEPCPEILASFLSRITFWWMNGLVLLGYKKSLEDGDLWAPNPRDMTCNTYPVFDQEWKKELAQTEVGMKQAGLRKQMSKKYGLGRQTSRSSYRSLSEANEKTPLLTEPSVVDETVEIKAPKKKTPSLFKTMAKVYGFTLLKAHLCKLVCDGLTFVGPILQSALISYTEDPNMQTWKGYLFASMFFVTSVVNSFFFHQLFHIGMTLGMRIKASVIAAVYKKALTMSNEARKTSTVGEIVNLMSVDAQRLQDATGYLWMVWSSPLQIVIAVYMLWGILGPSVLAGLAVMVLLIPVNGVMASYQRKLQISQMTLKDQRIKLMNEVLNGIKVLKLYAWELSFKEKINAIRNLELITLKKYAYLSAFGSFTWTCAPFLVTLACFATYTLSGGVLDANKAFVSLSLFNILRFPITLLPMMISYLVTVTLATFVAYVETGHNLDARKAFVSLSLFNILRFPINLLPMMLSYLVTASVSIKRIGKFLQNADIDFESVQHNAMAEYPMTIERGTFAWGTEKDDSPVLKNIDIHIPDNKLVAVVGQVGCGKSSLISALLGEMEKLDGRVNVRGSVAYVAQQAWIQNNTLKENILFGKPCNERLYDEVLEACALKPDLEILPAGDLTEIGEKGINLSGGQKQRVSLARAVYNDADIYLLDDPLSAVDSHVGKHIFEKVIGAKGLLHNKTRMLVTHGVHWLPMVDNIIVIVNGEVSEVGSYEELLSHDGAFAQFLKTYLTQEESDSEEDDAEVKAERKKILERVVSIISDEKVSQTSDKNSGSGTGSKRRSRKKSSVKSGERSRRQTHLSRQKSKIEEAKKDTAGKDKLIQDEKAEAGKVKWSVFFGYVAALGLLNAILWFLFFILFQVASVLSNVWLSVWTEDPLLNNNTMANTSQYANKRDLYLGVYGGLGVVQALFVLLYAVITAVSMIKASRKLHEGMLFNILRSPMSFFDTTPIGRIINRFSRDIETIDNVLPQLIRSWMSTFFTVISTVVVISYSTPIFLAVILPVGILYYFIQRFYIPTSRQLKRVESTSRSPIYVHFSETVTGASTIRAYSHQERFIDISDNKVDRNLSFYFAGIAANRWLGFRLEFIGALIVLSAALFAVIGKDTLQGGIVGLSISYALQVTQSLNWMVRMTSDLETNVVSVERVKEYSETPQEAEWTIAETRPHHSWPSEGRVAFESYSTRYRLGLDLVLRNITVEFKAGEKVGIVGRTGAGKSSLTLALFRLIEAAGGSIVIDGMQIGTLGLHQLRSKITILPQDPVLFSGTLRMNLDPFDQYNDDQVWAALEHAHLKDFVSQLPAKLDYECGEGGQNLSVGQRQLVCLARTLLRKTKILVLDEATAAVDLETDDLIQKTIREEFHNCTVITIAHRLNTIMDSDRILVLDAGRIAEFDSPENLMQNKESIFFGMAKDAGLAS